MATRERGGLLIFGHLDEGAAGEAPLLGVPLAEARSALPELSHHEVGGKVQRLPNLTLRVGNDPRIGRHLAQPCSA